MGGTFHFFPFQGYLPYPCHRVLQHGLAIGGEWYSAARRYSVGRRTGSSKLRRSSINTCYRVAVSSSNLEKVRLSFQTRYSGLERIICRAIPRGRKAHPVRGGTCCECIITAIIRSSFINSNFGGLILPPSHFIQFQVGAIYSLPAQHSHARHVGVNSNCKCSNRCIRLDIRRGFYHLGVARI